MSGKMISPEWPSLSKFWKIALEAINGEEQVYTSGSLKKALVLLSIPMILEMLMESLFAVVDAFFVARVGTEAMATVGLTESVLTIVYSLGFGMAMAATAVIARRIGEKNPAAAAHAAGQAIVVASVIAIFIGSVGIWFAGDILRLMGGTASLVNGGMRYTQIMLGTNLLIMLLFLLNGIFRGAGDASIAMRTLFIANGINIVMDPVLILGLGPFPALGLEGAAIATVIGRGVGVCYQLFVLFGKNGIIKLKLPDFNIDWQVTKRIINIAATGAGQFIIMSASWIFLMRIVAHFGSDAVAGYTIGIRLIIFTILPAMGIANAAATLVGQNLGAKQPERAEKSVWLATYFNMAFLFLVSIAYFIFAYTFVHAFSQVPSVVEPAVTTIRVMSVGYVIYAFAMVVSHSFNGAGDTRTPTIINFICFWLIEIPLGYVLAIKWEWAIFGVCLAVVLSETLMAILLYILFKKGDWKKVEV